MSSEFSVGGILRCCFVHNYIRHSVFGMSCRGRYHSHDQDNISVCRLAQLLLSPLSCKQYCSSKEFWEKDPPNKEVGKRHVSEVTVYPWLHQDIPLPISPVPHTTLSHCWNPPFWLVLCMRVCFGIGDRHTPIRPISSSLTHRGMCSHTQRQRQLDCQSLLLVPPFCPLMMVFEAAF